MCYIQTLYSCLDSVHSMRSVVFGLHNLITGNFVHRFRVADSWLESHVNNVASHLRIHQPVNKLQVGQYRI